MRRTLIFSTILILTFAGLLALFYWHYERYSLILIYREDVHYEKANAIKHATASAEIYLVFAPIIGDDAAEKHVLTLGKISEYLEKTVRRRALDSPKELFKDMHNNQVGITAARWKRDTQSKQDMRKTIRAIADKGALSRSEEESSVPKSLADKDGYEAIREVDAYFQIRRPDIIRNTRKLLEEPTT